MPCASYMAKTEAGWNRNFLTVAEEKPVPEGITMEIEKQKKIVAEFDPKIDAAAADYQELTRLLAEKEEAELLLMDLMEQWEAAQE